MARSSVCSNCGNELKETWMVCKNCHQARWDRVTPYLIWGALFVVFGWWSLTQKIPIPSGWNSIFLVMLPILGAVFGLIGIVMLLMGIIATLRGMSVRK